MKGVTRRCFLGATGLLFLAPEAGASSHHPHPQRRWFLLADEMKRQAESSGDRSYGAVVVLESRAIGLGPSRVVIDRNPDAHAERVAIWDAQKRLGRSSLAGAVLYSTSRPCALCEEAAHKAQMARMYFGSSLEDAGAPGSMR